MKIEYFSHLPEKGLYVSECTKQSFNGKPCLFLDRDGVVVEETNYLHRLNDLRVIPGVAAAIARANRSGVPVILVTNQSGIGRGYYGWREFQIIQDELSKLLLTEQAHFDLVLACAYHKDGLPDFALADHPWRKPNPGMLLQAQQLTGLDLSRSFIVGDNRTDLQAGRAADLHSGALVMTGHGRREYESRSKFDLEDFVWNRFENAISAWLDTFNCSKDET
jgi:D-glycero-D-manno-heptose 1,7-bisphosphate phosphatase